MLDDVLVRDWMSSDVISVGSKTTIAEAHEVMKNNSIRRLPVMDKENLVGIVTIGDIREASPSGATTLSIWELNYLWAQLKVRDVMSKDLITVSPDDPIRLAAKRMLEHKIAGLPVMIDGQVVGIITESDIFQMVVSAAEKA